MQFAEVDAFRDDLDHTETMNISGLVEPKAAGAGATTAFLTAGFGLAFAYAARWLFDWSTGSVAALATAFVVFGCVLGGFRAGLGAPRSPLTNGAAAGAIAGVSISLAQRLITGKGVNPVGLIFVAFLSASLGVFGAMVANGSRRVRGRV